MTARATKVLIDGWEVPDGNVHSRRDEVIVTALHDKSKRSLGDYDVSVVTAAGLKVTVPTNSLGVE